MQCKDLHSWVGQSQWQHPFHSICFDKQFCSSWILRKKKMLLNCSLYGLVKLDQMFALDSCSLQFVLIWRYICFAPKNLEQQKNKQNNRTKHEISIRFCTRVLCTRAAFDNSAAKFCLLISLSLSLIRSLLIWNIICMFAYSLLIMTTWWSSMLMNDLIYASLCESVNIFKFNMYAKRR